MFKLLYLRAAALVASLIFVALPAVSAEFVVSGSRQEGAFITSVPVKKTYVINDFSQPISACENMTIYWERGNSAQVTLYPADSDDDTVAEIEANAPIKTFTTNEHFGPFTPSKMYVRFVVDTVNATVASTARVLCSNQAVASGGGIPGLVGSTGNDETLSYLQNLTEFQSVSEQLTTTVYVDPFYGSDSTGDGSYASPYFSFSKIKTTCLTVPHSKCVVKGRDRWFTHTLLTLTYGAASTRHLMPGETVTFATQAGTAEVLAVDGNLAAVSWLSGADPRVNGVTTFSAGGGESVGTVTAVRDSLNGLPARVIAAADITTGTDVIAGTAGTGHSFSNNDGPFLWYNQTTIPATTGSVLVEATTQVYICNVVANTSFQVSTSSTCAGVIDFTSQGTGSNQIIAGLDGNGLRKSINVSCRDNTRLCVLFKPEFADSPWRIDSGKLAGDGALYTEVNTQRWPDGNNGFGAGTYNTPTGGLFIATDTAAADPTTKGWIGVENGVIQNLADDCFFTSHGGKIVALRVRCNIRNGTGDRSQNGSNPKYQSHNSVASATGSNSTDATRVASTVIMIGADGSSSQMGSDQGSGGFLNPNTGSATGGGGAIRFITSGTVKYDGISGATDCGGTTCNSPFLVQPGGEALVIGPHIIIGGNSTQNQLMYSTGGWARTVWAKTVADSRGVQLAASAIGTDAPFVNIAGGLQDRTKQVLGYNVTFRATGPHTFLTLCPLLGTSAATATSRLEMLFENTVMEWITSASASFRSSVTDCGVAGYTDADAVARASVKVRGIWDVDDDNPGCSGPCFFYNISSRPIGSCGSNNTFLNDVCTAVDSAGNNTPDDAWEWFSTRSADSGGVGVDGLQWATTDPQLRCASSAKECYGGTYVNVPTYTLSLRDYWSNSDVPCIPEDVLGKQVCDFTLASVHAGAR